MTACFLLLQALIDRPDVVRRVENFKRLTLTDFKVDIHTLAKKKALTKALDDNGKIRSSLAYSSAILADSHCQ